MKSVDVKSAAITAGTQDDNSFAIAQQPIPRTGFMGRWAKSFVQGVLAQMTTGRIILEDKNERQVFGQPLSESGAEVLTAYIEVLSPQFYTDLVHGGSIGCGESYMQRHWSTPDLVALVRVIVLNMHVLDGVDGQRSLIKRLVTRILHRLNANSREGSRRNISAHYDLSNAFFASFLDPTMMYSAAIFPNDNMSLHEASLNKLTHICERLQLKATDHLLEIGTGWGSLAIHAAQHYGCRVTTTTLSRQQYELAEQRIRDAGLQDRVNLLLKDYRDLEGHYDKLVSIEMIEAVGHDYYSSYFSKCSSLLKPEADADSGNHYFGSALRTGPTYRGLHSAVYISGWLPAQQSSDRAPRLRRHRHADHRPGRHHPRLCPHTGTLARCLPSAESADSGTGIHPRIPENVGLLPCLLPGWLHGTSDSHGASLDRQAAISRYSSYRT